MNKDYDKIAKIEKAIKDKYGAETIQNPKKSWNKEKESKYLEDLKEFYSKASNREKEVQQANGFTIKSKKLTKQQCRHCPVCGIYSLDMADDLYMRKFECCFTCYIQYVEGREERWKTGWRPNN